MEKIDGFKMINCWIGGRRNNRNAPKGSACPDLCNRKKVIWCNKVYKVSKQRVQQTMDDRTTGNRSQILFLPSRIFLDPTEVPVPENTTKQRQSKPTESNYPFGIARKMMMKDNSNEHGKNIKALDSFKYKHIVMKVQPIKSNWMFPLWGLQWQIR